MGIFASHRPARALATGMGIASLVALLVSDNAWAQDGPGPAFDVPATRFRPAADRLGILDVEWPALPLAGSWDIRLSLSAVARPLVVQRGGVELGALVNERLSARLSGALVLLGRVQIGVSMPVVLHQTQDGELEVGEVHSAGQGDLRVVLKRQILQADAHGVALGALLEMTLPTARAGTYYGEHRPTFEPMLAIARALGPVRLAGNIGYRARRDILEPYAELEDEWLARVAARYQPSERIPLGIALGVSSALDRDTLARRYAEVLFGVDAGLVDSGPSGSLFGFAMAGAGIADGLGTPRWRVVVGVFLSRHVRDGDGVGDDRDRCALLREDHDGYQDGDGCPEYDNDGDGVLDVDDRAPMEAEQRDGLGDDDSAPERDADGDGFLDTRDRCPDAAETVNGWQDDDGCPDDIPDSDGDGDGVADGDDRCPMQAGPVENRGCPDSDRDGDTIIDRLDHCPDTPGPSKNQGCRVRQFVSLRGKEIALMETLRFSTDGARLTGDSMKVLRNIADIMQAHPEVALLEIQGHTDDRGGESYNLALSQQRADTVRRLLIEAGVEPDRLLAKGFGESQPLESNATARGRAKNRRVEFNIVQDERDQSERDPVTDSAHP